MAGFIRQEDRDMVKAWVTGADHVQYSNLPEDVVCILLTHSNLSANHPDIRLNLHTTVSSIYYHIVYMDLNFAVQIGDVKEKFRTHIGTPVVYQRLILKKRGQVVCELADDARMLGFYTVESGDEIHVIDSDPFSLSRGGGLTDTSLVEKYKMSDEAYDKRQGTLREYIKEQRAKDPNFKLKASSNPMAVGAAGGPAPVVAAPDAGPETVAHVTVGARCEVMPGKRRGSVQFVGEVPELKGGHWVGACTPLECL